METPHYGSPPEYSPPLSAPPHTLSPSQLYEGGGAPGSLYERGQPQTGCLSPPGLVRALQGLIAGLSFIILACAASALVWDMGYSNVPGLGADYSSAVSSLYPTPYSAKAVMISMAVINFLSASAFLAGSFSRTSAAHRHGFYLALLLVDVTMAILQGAVDVVFVLGVNPMTQGSPNMLQNPMLLMCQKLDGDHAWEGAGGVGGFPMYTQYLFHYCYMDAQEIVAMICGFLAALALALAAYFAHKTWRKIRRHGKHSNQSELRLGAPEGPKLHKWPSTSSGRGPRVKANGVKSG
ncbi:hypothetical protein SKAU_G00375860 [Synaphobranchus kaupii]|uniref:MARVEL domain-containing protein n=1 Tax=Synaphobranchus kaupii TaxID=118154 RepID=A0A9Q1ECT0_SYNKA|nr:hypothetical protein SKAU_G00375860 [Synaphobranchus kaupii]